MSGYAIMRIDLVEAARSANMELSKADVEAVQLAADLVLSRGSLVLNLSDQQRARHGAVIMSELFKAVYERAA